MLIDWPHVRLIILNDRVNGYKPDRASLDKLALLFPDIKVFGFKRYYEYHWAVIAQSYCFPPDESLDYISAVPMSSLIQYSPKILSKRTN